MPMQQVARRVSTSAALTILLAGCGRDREPETVDSSDWGTGIVQHDGPAPAVIQGPRVATPQALAAGHWDSPKQMYDATCGGCHGVGVGPHLLGQALPEPYIRYVARNGLRAMPPFRPTDYTDAEIATLASWINAQPAAQITSEPAPTTPPRPRTPTQVAGGSEAPAAYAKCSGCHEAGAPPLRGRGLLEGHVRVVVRNGLRRMPAFPESNLSDADLTALVAWLNERPGRAP